MSEIESRACMVCARDLDKLSAGYWSERLESDRDVKSPDHAMPRAVSFRMQWLKGQAIEDFVEGLLCDECACWIDRFMRNLRGRRAEYMENDGSRAFILRKYEGR